MISRKNKEITQGWHGIWQNYFHKDINSKEWCRADITSFNIKKPFYKLEFVEKTQFLPEGDMEFVKSFLVLPFPEGIVNIVFPFWDNLFKS